VHRDLKPENIMIPRDGRPKILDFGLAQRTEPRDAEEATLTEPGTVAGTAGYMSPEQVRGQKLDWRSDIFSWAVVRDGDRPPCVRVCVCSKPWRQL
jgi:serine/threonine protein kinase